MKTECCREYSNLGGSNGRLGKNAWKLHSLHYQDNQTKEDETGHLENLGIYGRI
jgi:hypothetical protein